MAIHDVVCLAGISSEDNISSVYIKLGRGLVKLRKKQPNIGIKGFQPSSENEIDFIVLVDQEVHHPTVSLTDIKALALGH